MSFDHAHAHVNLCLCRLHQKQFRITTCTNQKQHGINIPIANELNTCFPLQAEAVIAAVEGGNVQRNLGSSAVEQKREAGPPAMRIQEAHVVNALPLLTEDAWTTLSYHLPLLFTDAVDPPPNYDSGAIRCLAIMPMLMLICVFVVCIKTISHYDMHKPKAAWNKHSNSSRIKYLFSITGRSRDCGG